jgi:hypothetical protein
MGMRIVSKTDSMEEFALTHEGLFERCSVCSKTVARLRIQRVQAIRRGGKG